MPTQKF